MTTEDGTIRALPSPPRGYKSGAAARMGRPRRRPGRSGGDRRRRRARAVRLVADPLRDGGRQRTVGRRRARAGVDDRTGQVGRRSHAGLVRHPDRRPGRRGRAGRALPRRRSSSGSASASASTTARSIPITPRRCWCRCSSTRTSRSWCPRRPTRASSHKFDPEHTADRAGSGQHRLAGYPQGGHRDSRAAQGEAVPHRRRADPDRVRPDGLRCQPGHGEVDRPARAVEPRHHRRCVPVGRVHPDRADALGASEPGGQHAGHRHGRYDVDADDVPRQPARQEQAERHPAGGSAECRMPDMWFSPTSAATAR